VRAAFVAAMEDVLALDEEPYDPTRPKVNFDETSKPRMAESRVPLPPHPASPRSMTMNTSAMAPAMC
jgi:hypothetical protein